MNNAISVSNYEFKKSDFVLIDTNVWFYVHGPQGDPNDWKTKVYSAALQRLFEANSHALVDILVIAEFVNSFCRHEYKLYQGVSGTTDFKTFRKSSYFKSLAAGIANSVRLILGKCKCIGTGFESLDFEKVVTDYALLCPDFNDQILAELCKSNGFMLLTNDGDFRDFEVSILTANNKLLN